MKISSRFVVGWLAGVGLAATCWTTGCTKKVDAVSPQARLEQETGTRWVVKIDPATGTPRVATAVDPTAPVAVDGVSYEAAARTFLGKYKDLFQLKDVAQELTFIDVVEVGGEAVARFQQRAGGLPIDRKTLSVWFRADKSVAMIAGSTHPRAADAATAPAVTAEAAVAAVEADLKKRYPEYDTKWLSPAPKPEAVLYPSGPGAKLAWALRVDLASAKVSTVYSYRVDAKDGALLEGYEDRPSLEGSGTDALGAKRAIRVSADGSKPGSYIMVQPAEAGLTPIATGSVDPQSFPIGSSSLTDWDPRTPGQGGVGAAVSAHANLAVVQDYFRMRFKWSSFDNKGSPLRVFVHDPTATAQSAYWDMANGIHFDDGSVHKGGPFKPFAAALDVCAHEYTHGVMQHRVPGGLVNQGESGAVNEALGDIFGVFVKKAIGGAGRPELFGDLIYSAGYRDLAHPSNQAVGQNLTGPEYRQPDSMKKKFVGFTDNGGVHINSGIVSNAFYLMTVGGTNDTSKLEVRSSLGWEKSEDLWWTVTAGFHPAIGITEVAEQTMSAALRKYKAKSPEFQAVACAWVATEVISAEDVKSDFDVSCAPTPCTSPEAGVDHCTCRASDPNDGSLCKSNASPVCTEVQTFTGQHGASCTGYVRREVTVSRCFCAKADGTLLCPSPYQFTPPRGCPDDGGFKSYFGTGGSSCSGNYAGTDSEGNEINETGSGTLKDCVIEATDQKWESATGTLDCNSAAGGGPGKGPCL
ncbi:MAG: M4 family metallopeptidase [Myxococcales bacterium]|nr:M4 family metallopeptidase [Myxococcales bacterium]